jgi:pimeloyl-ACP methyl ester carboxylesterase
VSERLADLAKQVRGFRQHIPSDAAHAQKPLVILLHGMGGDRNDWISPFQDRNWPYDHHRDPDRVDLGVHSRPPIATLPGVERRRFLSPRVQSNSRGADGSDDRSWWHALVEAGFALLTYSQHAGLMLPFREGPVAEFTGFMETLQHDLLGQPEWQRRQVVIVGHSRGGLIARAYLGQDEVKSDAGGRFPRVDGLITISSPHRGSQMALLDDRVIGFLDKVERFLPLLPDEVIEGLKDKVDAYVGEHGDEIEPDSPLFRALEAQEPVPGNVRYITVGGTSPRFLRVYVWLFTAGSNLPRRSADGKIEFHWQARAREVKGASPFPEGLPLRLLRLRLDEIMAGLGDGLTADERCRLPASFDTEEHISVPLSHAEELWSPDLQAQIIERLLKFQ